MYMATTGNQKRLVLNVPADFHKTLKVMAAAQGKDMRDLVMECMTDCFARADVEALKSGSPPKKQDQPQQDRQQPNQSSE